MERHTAWRLMILFLAIFWGSVFYGILTVIR